MLSVHLPTVRNTHEDWVKGWYEQRRGNLNCSKNEEVIPKQGQPVNVDILVSLWPLTDWRNSSHQSGLEFLKLLSQIYSDVLITVNRNAGRSILFFKIQIFL